MAVAFDALGPGATGTSSTTTGLPVTLSWSHTCSGVNRLIVAIVTFANTFSASGSIDSPVTMTATFAGVNMGSLGLAHPGDSNSGYVQLFYLVNPPTGTSTLLVNATGYGATLSNAIIAGSVSFTGVDPVSPFVKFVKSTGNSAAASLVIPGSATGMFIDGVAAGSGINSSNQTVRWKVNVNSSGSAGNAGSSTAAGAVSATMGYVVSATDFWGMVGVCVQAYVAPTSASTAWHAH